MYKNFSIEEAESIGTKFIAVCDHNGGYEFSLTVGKEYEIEITPRILTMSPLCKGVGDNGKGFECHLERFTKI